MLKKILVVIGIIIMFLIILLGLAKCAATPPEDPDSIPGVVSIREAKTQYRIRRLSLREGREVTAGEVRTEQPKGKNVGNNINSTITGILPFPDKNHKSPKMLTPEDAIDQCYEILEHYRAASWLEIKTIGWLFNTIAKRVSKQSHDAERFKSIRDIYSPQEIEQMKKDIPQSQKILSAIKAEFKDVATDQEKDMFGGFINALSDVNTALAKELQIEDPMQDESLPQIWDPPQTDFAD